MHLRKILAKKKRIFQAISILFMVLLLTLSGLRICVLADANSVSKNAVKIFDQDKTTSLIALIDSEEFSLKERNEAIWALGVLKDKDALLKLESLYTGEECDHNTDLCQYEIEKAIRKINNKFIGSWQVSY